MNSHDCHRLIARSCLCVLALALLACPVLAAEKTNTWIGSASTWSDPNAWSLGEVPNNGVDSYWAIVDGEGTLPSVVPVDANIRITTGTVTGGDTVEVLNGQFFSIDGGELILDGTLRLSSSGSVTRFGLLNESGVSGAGRILTTDNPNNHIIPTLDRSFQFGPGITLQGACNLGGNEGGLENHGTIVQQGSAPILVDTRQPKTFENHGVLQAEGVGGLRFNTSTVNNTTWPISILDGSKLDIVSSTLNNHSHAISLQGNANLTIENSTVGNAAIVHIGGGTANIRYNGDSTIDNVSSRGLVSHSDGATVRVRNDVTHEGVWTMNGSGNWTSLVVYGGSTVDGSLELALSDSPNNRVSPELNTTMTLDDEVWLHGAGSLGLNEGGLVNHGSVVADAVNPLVIDTRQPLTFENHGYLEAVGPGGLVFSTATVNNYNNPLYVSDGSRLDINSSILNNGGLQILMEAAAQLNVTNSTVSQASIEPVSSEGERGTGEVTYSGTVTLSGVQSHAKVVQSDGATVTISDSLSHIGEWFMNGAGNWTALRVLGDGGLFGNFDLYLSDSPNNRLYPELNTTMTIGSGISIHGAGQLGLNEGGIINDGLVLATDVNPFVIDSRQPLAFENNGLMMAWGPGGFVFNTATVLNRNLPISIGDGSRLDMVSSTLFNSGLPVLLEGSAQMNVGNSQINHAQILSVPFEGVRGAGEVTYSGDVTLTDVVSTTSVVQTNGSTVRVHGGLHHEGPWDMQGAGNWTNLIAYGGSGLWGMMDLSLSDSPNNRIHPELNTDLIIGPDVTLEGAGSLGLNEGGFHNEGIVRATGNNPIVIDTRQPLSFENWGIVEVLGAGGLHLATATVNNYVHPINVAAPSRLVVDSSLLNNNGLDVSLAGSAPMTVQNSTITNARLLADSGPITFLGTSTIAEVSSQGSAVQANGSTVNVHGHMNHAGTWEMQGGGNWTNLIFKDWNTVMGNLQIVMSDSPNNRIYPALNQTFSVEPSVTIRGAGSLLLNEGGMTSHGVIRAEGTNPLRIDSRQPDTFDNYGELRALGSGGLQFDTSDVRNFVSPIVIEKTSRLSVSSSNLEGNGTSLILKAPAPLTIANSTVLGLALHAEDTTATLSGTVTLTDMPATGTIVQVDGATVNIHGDQFHNGLWEMRGGSNWTRLNGRNGGRLVGPMTIEMTDSPHNHIAPELNDVLTFGPDTVVRGSGSLGLNEGGLTNDGHVVATGSIPLLIDTRQPLSFANFGLLEAQGPGGIRVATSDFENIWNPVLVQDGSRLDFDSSAFRSYGAGIEAFGNGGIGFQNSSLQDASVVLDQGTLAFGGTNTLRNSEITGHVHQANGSSVTVADGLLTHHGLWEMAGSANTTNLVILNHGAIAGTGTMQLSPTELNRIYPDVNTTMYHGENHSIRGAGTILMNQGGLYNEGLFAATDAPGMTFDIRSGFEFVNDGGLHALFPGTIQIIRSNLFSNLGHLLVEGTTLSADGDLTQYDGTTELRNGTIDVAGTFNLFGGKLIGQGGISGDLTNDGGVVAPGDGASFISVSGTYRQSSGSTLSLDVYPAEKRHAHLRGSGGFTNQDIMSLGAAELGGRIEVVFNEYTPSLNEVFPLMFFEVSSGVFNEVVGVNLPAGLALAPVYESSLFSVRVVGGPTLDPRIVNSAMIPISPGKAMVSFRDSNPDGIGSYLITVSRVSPVGTWMESFIVNSSVTVIERSQRVGQTTVFDLPLHDIAIPTSWEGDYTYDIYAYPELDAAGEGVFATMGSQHIASTNMEALDVVINPDGSYTLRLSDQRPTGADWMYEYVFYEQTFVTSRSILTPLHITNNGRTGVMSAADVGTPQVIEYTYTPEPGAIGWYVRSLATVYGADEGRIGQFDIGFQSPYVHGTVPYGPSLRDSDGDGFGDELEMAMGTSYKDAKHRPAFADVDGDGVTTMRDAFLLHRRTSHKPLPWRSYNPSWDVNADGKIDRQDSEALFSWLTGGGEFRHLPAK